MQRVILGKDALTEEDFESIKLRLATDGVEVELMDAMVEKDFMSRAWDFETNWARKEDAAVRRVQ